MNVTSRRLRKITCGFLMLVMMVCLLAGCATEPVNKNPYNVEVLNHTSDFYVNDFAGILSEDQKSDMMERAVQLDTEYSGIQVVVSIVESFEKTVVSYEGDASTNMVYDIEQLAYAMYDQYGIGQDDMGILIFFSVGDREVRIETGYQMQTYITDQKSGQLLDNHGMEYFRNDQFADGLVAVQAATIEEIRQIVPANWNEFVEADKTEQEEPADKQEDAPVVNSGTTSADETEKDPNKGILAGLIGIICAMFAAIGAFFYNLFTGKKRREAEAAAHAKELSDQKANYEKEIASINGAHKAKLDQVANRYKTDMTTKQQEIDSLRGQLTMESNRHDDTRRQLSMLEEKFQRVQILHPEYDFNQEVVDMIEGEFKEEARKVDEKLSQVIMITPDKDKVDFFDKAKTYLSSVKPEVRRYVTTEAGVIEGLLNKSKELKAAFDRAEKEKKDKQAASDVYKHIKEVYENNPTGSFRNFVVLSEAFRLFNRLTQDQKGYFPDVQLISKFQKVYATAEEDHENYTTAKEAEKSVRATTDRIVSADEDDRSRLSNAKRFYDGLSTAQKGYFDKDLLARLNKLIRDAENDHQDQERRRRQRRQQSSYNSTRSSSSYRSSSSFGGRGGRPSGGGASRRF